MRGDAALGLFARQGAAEGRVGQPGELLFGGAPDHDEAVQFLEVIEFNEQGGINNCYAARIGGFEARALAIDFRRAAAGSVPEH